MTCIAKRITHKAYPNKLHMAFPSTTLFISPPSPSPCTHLPSHTPPCCSLSKKENLSLARKRKEREMRNHKLVPTTCSSSKNSTKQEQQPHLSGAYIRSLVKQLSSSSTTRSNKDHHHPSTMVTSKPHGQPHQEEQQQAPQATSPPPQQQHQPHKKQVRRRLHTSRPYQERLLNMAEARREIVTALKIHRASMRQAKEQQHQQQQQLLRLQHQQDQVQVVVQEQGQLAARACNIAPMSYGGANSFPDYLYNSPFTHLTSCSTSSYSSSPPLPYMNTPVVAPMADALDHHLLPLPAQPLGLNLSFHGFSCIVGDDAKHSTSSFDPPPLLQQSPASSYSIYSSPTSVTMASHDMSSAAAAAVVTADNTTTSQLAADASLHRVLDDEEMAVIYSIGEQHDIEWSDTVNLVTSAWWSKLLESVEGGGGDGPAAAAAQQTVGAVNAVGDTPDSWFGDQGTSGSCSSDVLETTHLSERYHHGGYGDEDDSALPRMEIGEIEGWDAEWFS